MNNTTSSSIGPVPFTIQTLITDLLQLICIIGVLGIARWLGIRVGRHHNIQMEKVKEIHDKVHQLSPPQTPQMKSDQV